MKNTIPQVDWGQKLDSTVCRYKGEPVWIRVGERKIFYYKLPNNNNPDGEIKKDDPDFDISSVPLGYVNYKFQDNNQVLYLYRAPVRRVKQGFSAQSLRYMALPDHQQKLPVNATNIIFSDSFVNMIKEVYPSLEASVTYLRTKLKEDGEKSYQIAISRNIALAIYPTGVIHVFYKNNYVGWIAPNKMIVHVKDDAKASVVSKYLSHVLGWEID